MLHWVSTGTWKQNATYNVHNTHFDTHFYIIASALTITSTPSLKAGHVQTKRLTNTKQSVRKRSNKSNNTDEESMWLRSKRSHAYFIRELKRNTFPSFRFSSKSKDRLASLPDVCMRAKLTVLMSSNLTNSAGLCTKMKPLSNGYRYPEAALLEQLIACWLCLLK